MFLSAGISHLSTHFSEDNEDDIGLQDIFTPVLFYHLTSSGQHKDYLKKKKNTKFDQLGSK